MVVSGPSTALFTDVPVDKHKQMLEETYAVLLVSSSSLMRWWQCLALISHQGFSSVLSCCAAYLGRPRLSGVLLAWSAPSVQEGARRGRSWGANAPIDAVGLTDRTRCALHSRGRNNRKIDNLNVASQLAESTCCVLRPSLRCSRRRVSSFGLSRCAGRARDSDAGRTFKVYRAGAQGQDK